METQQIEYKALWKDDYLKWICGFANAQGGILSVVGENHESDTNVTDNVTMNVVDNVVDKLSERQKDIMKNLLLLLLTLLTLTVFAQSKSEALPLPDSLAVKLKEYRKTDVARAEALNAVIMS
jgi:ATP-dependent DNA helicase RecG